MTTRHEERALSDAGEKGSNMTRQAKTIDSLHSIGEIAATLPGAAAVFHKYKIRFCCHGDQSLADAARKSDIDLDNLIKALEALDITDDTPALSQSTHELIQHILTRYHEVHRHEFAEMIALSRKVEAVHADHPVAPTGLADLLHQMLGELEVHMKKEEIILFPAMQRSIEGRFNEPISKLRHDHKDQGEQLHQIESLTNDFTPPDDACRSWQALYAGTAKLTEDLMTHIHLENNVLFPRFEGSPRS